MRQTERLRTEAVRKLNQAFTCTKRPALQSLKDGHGDITHIYQKLGVHSKDEMLELVEDRAAKGQ